MVGPALGGAGPGPARCGAGPCSGPEALVFFLSDCFIPGVWGPGGLFYYFHWGSEWCSGGLICRGSGLFFSASPAVPFPVVGARVVERS